MHEKFRLGVLGLAVTGWLSGCVGIGGETVRLSHEELEPPAHQFTPTLRLETPVSDLRKKRGRIGRATITVFAITSGHIHTQTPMVDEVADEVKLALEGGGYTVEPVTETDPGNGETPMVKVAIRNLWFLNYNWFWPLVPTWGNVEIAMSVEDSAGLTLFEQTFSATGNSYCLTGHCAFETATRKAMTAICQQIRDAVASDEFRHSLEAAPAAALLATGHGR